MPKIDKRKFLSQENLEIILQNQHEMENHDDFEDQYESTDEGEMDNDSFSENIITTESESGDENNAFGSYLQTFQSKNKTMSWCSEYTGQPKGRFSKHNILREKAGPTKFAIREIDSISSSFLIYFREPLLKIIIQWTNEEGCRVYNNEWKAIDIIELKRFFGILILIGVYRSKNEAVSDLWNLQNGRKIFNSIMSRNRFSSIMRVIRFDNASERRHKRSSDKLAPIRELFDKWNSHLQDAYVPNWSMTVDEQLVAFRGKCPFRQYMMSKPAKYGIKFWAICDSVTSYAWKLEVYTGKKDIRESNQGENVVKRLTKEIEKSGRNITCDNFFTSYALAMHLISRNLSLVGTIRKNKPELPIEFTNSKNRTAYSTLFGFQDNATIISYCPKKGKVVTLLSTMHNNEIVDTTEQRKPQIILDYNKTKGGVDTMDKMVNTYSTKRMTRRWPLIVFYNMLDISAMNAYIVWLSMNSNYDIAMTKRRNFLLHLGKELAGYTDEEIIPVSIVTLEPSRKSRKSRCCICPSTKDRKTRTLCVRCQGYVCGEHSIVYCTSCGK